MAWIEGTEERTFVIDADYDEVVEYFCNPDQFREAFGEMESGEEIEPGVWKWTLVEKAEKGINFQGIYTVRYEREGDVGTWETLEGNSRSEGRVEFRDVSGGTEVHYLESLSFDLPIPRLAAKIFKPIVAREIRSGVGDFLDRSKEILESR